MTDKKNFLAVGGYPFSEFGGYIRDVKKEDAAVKNAILPDDGRFDVYCHRENEKIKMEAARDIYNQAPIEAKKEICSNKCRLKCFIN